MNDAYNVAVITISDKGSKGEREDVSGKVIIDIVESHGWCVSFTKIIPDEFDQISALLAQLADEHIAELILTTGGTGFSKRDVTPEATKAILDKEAPGIAEAMRYESMKKTTRGMLSRAVAGIRKDSLIINLPGSPKAVTECLEAVIEPVYHGVEILVGSAFDCAMKEKEERGIQLWEL